MQIDQQLLDKFWRGESSKDEVRKVLKWFNSIDAEIYFSDNIDYIWHQYKNGKIAKHLSETAYRRIQKKIADPEVNYKIKAPRKNFYYLKVAAVFIFLFAAVAIIKLTVLDEEKVEPAPLAIEWVEKSTKPGQKLTIFLNDGTKVMLNAGSTIRYANTYLDSARYVFLEGEAFFDVARDSLRPFTVYTEKISTTALGTSFNIRHYSDEPAIKIALVSGIVKVDSREIASMDYLLSKGQGVIYRKNTGASSKYDFNPVATLGWKDGIIYFKDATSNEIIHELEKWYGVEIQVNKPLNDKLYTGEFVNLSLEDVLLGLSYVKDFKFTIKNGNVVIN